MNDHTFRVLEYDSIRHRVAGLCACSLGAGLALEMAPSSDLDLVQHLLDETLEARGLLSIKGTIPLGGISDIRPFLKKADIGGVLSAGDLLDVYSTISSGKRLRAFLTKTGDDQFPLMTGLGSRIGVFPDLENEIQRAILPTGQVADNASPELARIRSRKRQAEQRIQEKLNSIIGGATRTLLQDPVIVQRSDRWCVPVKAEQRGALGGIVHDTSASGATLFVEPAAVVELGNEVRELTGREVQEVYRILGRLSDLVKRASRMLWPTVEALAQIDFIIARAALAQIQNAAMPLINKTGFTRLLSARHPLIDPEKVVAIDVVLGEANNRILLITGPNTGGKTVSLKTVGLLTLMAQSGLHVPAARAETSVFDEIHADIGDEQSIEQSLSTFSGHIRQIAAILSQLHGSALVLMDEVGVGTDPAEGAALARAVLEYLRLKDARVMATSHYGELKTYAFSTPGVQNASVEFDEQSLKPAYRLAQGLPGRSHAFAIAGRLGLPAEVLNMAVQMQAGPDETTDVLQALEEARRAALVDGAAAEDARHEAEALRRRAEKELTEYEGLRREIRQRALEEARAMIKKSQVRAKEILGDLRKIQAESSESERARIEVRELGASLEEEIDQLLELPQEPEPEEEIVLTRKLRTGDRVRVTTLGLVGQLLEDVQDGERVPVQVGSLRVSVDPSALRPVAPLPAKRAHAQASPGYSVVGSYSEESLQQSANVSTQIALLGQRADEAVGNLDRYIEDAYAAGIRRLRVIHGKGTGALRKAVQDHLKSNALVQEYATADAQEGGAGATVVALKE